MKKNQYLIIRLKKIFLAKKYFVKKKIFFFNIEIERKEK
jgi:hypothetical protein